MMADRLPGSLALRDDPGLIQTSHRFAYERAYRGAGMTIVEAATREELIAKISERTAMISVLVWTEKQTTFAPPFPVTRARPPGPEVMMLMARELRSFFEEAGRRPRLHD